MSAFFSLRTRLVLVSATLLLTVALFLIAFFPSRMDEFAVGWTQHRAVGMATLLANAAAPGLEFDDVQNVTELLGGLAKAPEVVYAVVRRPNGTVLAAWKPERVPQARQLAADAEPVVAFEQGAVRVDTPVTVKTGAAGTLTMGFSLEELEHQKRSNLTTVAIVAGMLFFLGLLVSFLLGTFTVRPIQQMTQAALQIAAGDLSHRELPVKRRDEVGRMAVAFDRLMVEQRAVIHQVMATSAQLGAAAVQLSASSQQQESAAAQQSAGVEEVSRTMQSLLQSAAHIADAATGVLVNAERTKETGEGTSARIADLTGHTNRIAELLEVIRDISDRSDLLALNASLEATRAGEAGRGFALVAAEIRRLSERVTATVLDVKSFLADVRKSGAAAVMSTEEGRALADDTTESARQITLVTHEQRTATERVTENTRQITLVLADSVASAQQTRASAEILRSHAEGLSEIIGRFRLEPLRKS